MPGTRWGMWENGICLVETGTGLYPPEKCVMVLMVLFFRIIATSTLSQKCAITGTIKEKKYFLMTGKFTDKPDRHWNSLMDAQRNLSTLLHCLFSWHPPHDWGIHPESMVYQYDTLPELINLYDPEKIHLRPNVEDSPAVRELQGHYGMISGVDKAFGQLMEKCVLKALMKVRW